MSVWLMVSMTDKPADTDLLWKKNIIPWLMLCLATSADALSTQSSSSADTPWSSR
jgi:hypothetical protein